MDIGVDLVGYLTALAKAGLVLLVVSLLTTAFVLSRGGRG